MGACLPERVRSCVRLLHICIGTIVCHRYTFDVIRKTHSL